MPQFLLSRADIDGNIFTLSGPEAFHVTRVLRRREGSEIELFDGKGGRFTGVIRSILPDGSVRGEITGTAHAPKKDYPVDLTLYLGLIKASQWEWALEKCTEVGVRRIVPVITPRTVVKVREFEGKKEVRWSKIVTAAVKQCGRAEVPEVGRPVHFRDAILAKPKPGLTLVAWEKRGGATTYAGLRDVLRAARANHPKGLTVSLFVGPEGGFSDEEIEIAEYEGASLVGLGPNTLRAETAAVAGAAIVLYELGAI